MNCKTSIDKTKDHMFDNGIIDKFNNLVAEDAPTLSRFNGYIAYIKDLAISKFGELPEAFKKPIFLEGKKVIFNNGFFDWVDSKLNNTISPKKNIIVTPVDAWKTRDMGNYEGLPEKDTKPIKVNLAKNRPFDTPEGATENFNDFVGRTIDEYNNTLATAPNNTVVVLSSQNMKVIEAHEKAGGKGHDIDINHFLNEETDNGEVIRKEGTNGSVYFIRHGETDDNVKGIERTKEVPLNEKGVDTANKSAKELKESLNGETPEIRSSSLPRAMQTANIIAEHLSKEAENHEQEHENIDPNKEQKEEINKREAENTYKSKITPEKKEAKEPSDNRKENRKAVVDKMKKILDTLGIKTEVGDKIFKEQSQINTLKGLMKDATPEQKRQYEHEIKQLENQGIDKDTAALADITNQLILFSKDQLSDDNFTEETIHFVIEALEQKNPELFNQFMDKIRGYSIYDETLKDYKDDNNYQKDGHPDYYKLKKEAIAKLITAKLLDVDDVTTGDKGFFGAMWDKITNLIKSWMGDLPIDVKDEFSAFAERLIADQPESLKIGENNTLNNVFAAKKKGNINEALSRITKLYGIDSRIPVHATPKEAVNFLLDKSALTELVEEKDEKTGETTSYYKFKDSKKVRVSDVLSASSNIDFKNLNTEEKAIARREFKAEKGTLIHKVIQDIIARYVDPITGIRRDKSIEAPSNLDVAPEIYKTLHDNMVDRLNSYPKDTYFLTELKVVNEREGYAGTIDFLAIMPNGKVDILDWKTTDMYDFVGGSKQQKSEVNLYQQKSWRNQVQLYKNALFENGLGGLNSKFEFRNTRAIPIGTDIGEVNVPTPGGFPSGNNIQALKSVKIGNADSSKISKGDSFFLPVSTHTEKVGNEYLDKTIGKLWGIYDRLERTSYPENQRQYKRGELDKLLLTIKEIQIKGEISSIKTLFNNAFIRYNDIKNYNFDYLDKEIELRGQGSLSLEREEELEFHIQKIAEGLEFTSVFDSKFATDLINSIDGLSKEDKDALHVVVGKAQAATSGLQDHLKELFTKMGKLFNIDDINAPDYAKGTEKFFMMFLPASYYGDNTIKAAYAYNREVKLRIGMEQAKLFDRNTGRFAVTSRDLTKWASDNKTTLWKGYEKLQEKDAKGKPILRLLSKLKKDYFEQLDHTKPDSKASEFDKEYSKILETFKGKGFRGDALSDAVSKKYSEHISKWIGENYDVKKYKEEYQKELLKYADEISKFKTDENPIKDEEKKSKWVNEWMQKYDIFSSPKALSDKNWILARTLNEGKWHTDEYKYLLKPENKALLDTFNLFQDLNKRAKDSGMLDDINAYWKFIPKVKDGKLTTTINAIKEIGDIISNPERSIGAELKQWNISHSVVPDAIDPLTGKQLRTKQIHYKYMEEGQEKNQSKDLFAVYEKWANHILHYDIVSEYENRFKALQLLESLKDNVYSTGAVSKKGRILNDSIGKRLTPKVNSDTENQLERLIVKYVYDTTYEDKSIVGKIVDGFITYTRHLFLSFNLGPQFANLTDAYLAGAAALGKWGTGAELANGYRIAMGITEGDLAKKLPSIVSDRIRKTDFLTKFLNLKIQNEFMYKSHYNANSILTSGVKELLGIGMKLYGWGDEKAQEALAYTFFQNTTLVDGKLENITDLVQSKHPEYTNLSPDQQSVMRTQMQDEINKMKKDSNLLTFVEKNGDDFTFKGLNLESALGKQQMRQYQAKFQRSLGEMIGNPDKFDPSYMDTIHLAKLLMQFKGWMPQLYGNRLYGYKYDNISDQYLWGRNNLYFGLLGTMSLSYANTMDRILTPILFTVKSLTGANLIGKIPGLDGGTGNFTYTDPTKSTNLQDVAKYMYEKKRMEFARDEKPFTQTQDQFVSMYLTKLKSQMVELQTIALLTAGALSAQAYYANNDDKNKWMMNRLASWFQNTNMQARFLFDPSQEITLLQRLIPCLSSLQNIVKAGAHFIEYPFIGQEKQDKAHVKDDILKTIPTVKQIHTWGKELSPDYAEYFNVRQPGAAPLNQ